MDELRKAARFQSYWDILRCVSRTHPEGTFGLRTYGLYLGATSILIDAGPFDTMDLDTDPSNEGLEMHIRYHVKEVLYLLEQAQPAILSNRDLPSWREVADLTMEQVNDVYFSIERFMADKREGLVRRGFI
ncbi:hypothetical protein HOD38_03200 [archaeon]|jgi:hypothetical protein|nr:hypothetical protein [archaeon]MBT4397246.1 hypothetical protein [archaeon]MBT4440626.1 hypothetical protein [archaeon]